MGTGIFITFSGNCKQALVFYQACFGGILHFETFDKALPGFREMPVVSGSLISDQIVIHGSDLIHNEGRKTGNYIAVYLGFDDVNERRALARKLAPQQIGLSTPNDEAQKLIEVTDTFDVRWVLGVSSYPVFDQV